MTQIDLTDPRCRAGQARHRADSTFGRETGAAPTRLNVGLPLRHVSGPGHESPTRLRCGAFALKVRNLRSMRNRHKATRHWWQLTARWSNATRTGRRGARRCTRPRLAFACPHRNRLRCIGGPCAGKGANLVVTGERAAALRVPCESDEVLLLTLPPGFDATRLA